MNYLGIESTGIHPRVKQNYRGLKYAGPVIFLLFLALAVGPYFFFRREFESDLDSYWLYIVLPLGLAFTIAYIYVRSKFGSGIKQMSRVLYTAPPEKMLVKGLGAGFGGREMVELSRDDVILGPVRIGTPNDGLFFVKDRITPATVYRDVTGNGTLVVIDDGSRLVWGDLAAMEKHDAIT